MSNTASDAAPSSAAPSNTGNGNINQDRRGHLVYTACNEQQQICLRIHTDGLPSNPFAIVDEFIVNQQLRTIACASTFNGFPHVIEDLGWFEDVEIFRNVCLTQLIPTRAGSVFNNWVDDVLATITTQHSTIWFRNTSNFV